VVWRPRHWIMTIRVSGGCHVWRQMGHLAGSKGVGDGIHTMRKANDGNGGDKSETITYPDAVEMACWTVLVIFPHLGQQLQRAAP
jgi:hypothetical protein